MHFQAETVARPVAERLAQPVPRENAARRTRRFRSAARPADRGNRSGVSLPDRRANPRQRRLRHAQPCNVRVRSTQYPS